MNNLEFTHGHECLPGVHDAEVRAVHLSDGTLTLDTRTSRCAILTRYLLKLNKMGASDPEDSYVPVTSQMAEHEIQSIIGQQLLTIDDIFGYRFMFVPFETARVSEEWSRNTRHLLVVNTRWIITTNGKVAVDSISDSFDSQYSHAIARLRRRNLRMQPQIVLRATLTSNYDISIAFSDNSELLVMKSGEKLSGIEYWHFLLPNINPRKSILLDSEGLFWNQP